MQPSSLRYLLDKGCALRLPISGTLELTGRCNLSCKMCYIHRARQDAAIAPRELSTAQWLSLAAQLQQAGTLTLLLTGGEPMLRPDFAELYLRCKRLGFLLSINTNATLLTPERFELLRANKPLIVNVSLYGASEQTYRRLCGAGEAFALVRENLLELRRLEIPVKLNYTVTEENFEDREAIYAFARENGFRIGQTSYLFPPLRAAGCDDCGYARVSPERAAEMLFACERCRYTPEELRLRLPPPGEPDDCGDVRGTQWDGTMRCRAGVSSFWITYDGTLQACGMLPSPSADLLQAPFSEAWRRVQTARGAVRLPEKCRGCALRERCEVCGAICAAEGGFAEPPEYICRKTARYRALADAYGCEDAME